jgi:hypothetical protein
MSLQIDFGHDLEQQLNLYVECRAAFSNLDAVTRELVLRVALLCMRAHRFVRGRHSKKTAAFVKACLAFCHITIPSLDDAFTRLHLFVEAAQVALVNQMMGQSEAFLKAAISLVQEVPPTIGMCARPRVCVSGWWWLRCVQISDIFSLFLSLESISESMSLSLSLYLYLSFCPSIYISTSHE